MAFPTVYSGGFEQREAPRVRGSRSWSSQSYGSFTSCYGAPANGRIIIHKSLEMERNVLKHAICFGWRKLPNIQNQFESLNHPNQIDVIFTQQSNIWLLSKCVYKSLFCSNNLWKKLNQQQDAVSILIQSQHQTVYDKRKEMAALKWFPGLSELQLYLNVKLQVALIHLSGDNAFNDLHRNQLEAVISRAKDVMCFPFLDLQIQKPDIQTNSV